MEPTSTLTASWLHAVMMGRRHKSIHRDLVGIQPTKAASQVGKQCLGTVLRTAVNGMVAETATNQNWDRRSRVTGCCFSGCNLVNPDLSNILMYTWDQDTSSMGKEGM